MQDELSDMEPDALDQIAVVGMACRFPKAADVDEFWRNLRDGVEGIHFFSEEELLAAGISRESFSQPDYVPAKGVLADADLFDADLFGLTPREAELMDPQQRLFLECCHRAFEHAGYDSGAYPGKVGVYGGSGFSSYLVMNLMTNLDFLMASGPLQARIFNDKDFLTTHVSYRLNLRGPSMAVQTACSTSLVAVHLASQALLEGECDMALAGGCTINFPQVGGYGYQEGSIFSPDGHCRSFDAKAAGTVEGNGGGAVLLKRLADALADGDTVYAVIRGSAVNNDGSQKAGFTAPSVESQTRVVLEAYAIAGVDPETVAHVEAHGSATPLGDPIEVESLTRAFRQSTDKKGFCGLGSVKSNIGHTDTGAGIASLLKTVQALRHGQLPPSLHFESPNPRLNLPESPFYVNATLKDWPDRGGPRRASINSLGIGGTNAHVVLEEAPELPPTTPSRPWQLVTLSARTSTALDAASENLAAHLADENAGDDFADVAHTLRVGRKPLKHRRVLVARDRAEAADLLGGSSGARVVTGTAGDGSGTDERAVTFLFPGLGEHYVGMGAELYEREPAFRRAIDKAAEVLEPILGADLRKVIYPEGFTAPTGAPGEKKQDMRRLLAAEAEPESDAERTLNRTAFAHPAIFAVEYALAELWKEWGITPQAMIGYSLGEYVAACLAGVFSYEDGLRLVARRAQLIDALPEGSMLAVPLPAEEVEPLLAEYGLSLSAANGPALSVVGGEPEAVDRFAAALGERNVACRKLKSSHAFHSHLMEPIAGEMRKLLAGMKLAAPATPVISNVTGTWLTEKEARDPDYWAEHLRKTVLFSTGLSNLLGGEPRLLLEVGPGQTLATLARQHPDRSAAQVAVASLRDRRDEVSDQAFLLEALGRLWVAGARPDWAGFTGAEKRRRVPIPTYPYERRRYFVDPGTMGFGATAPPPEDNSRLELPQWFSAPVWERLADEPAAAGGDLGGLRVLVFADEGGMGERLASRLAGRGAGVVTVRAGDGFAETGEGAFTVAPGTPADYKSLLKALKPRGFAPDRIVHLWNLGSEATGISPAALAAGSERGFYSLLFLAQALAEVEADRHEPMHLLAVADGLFEVTGGEPLAPAKATLLGPCRVLPQELPLLSALALDVLLPADDAGRDALADRLAAELEPLAGKREPVLAWRGPYAWVRRFRSVELPEAELPLRENGAYLVTGGLSDTGVALAEHLWRTCKARLALFLDAGVPQRERWADHLSAADEDDGMAKRMRRVLALEASGCDLFALTVDFERQDEIESAVRRALARFGEVHGVFHAAGAAGAGMALFKIREAAQMILAPKVLGTAVLAEELAGQTLDFFVLFGSNTAVTGGFGQVDTTAGAAFLDAVAAWDRAAGRRRFAAIDWGFFRWQPIQAPDPAIVEQLKAGLEAYGIGAAELTEVLARVIESGRAEVIVSTQPLERVIAQFESGGMIGALSGTSVQGGGDQPAKTHPRPELDVPYVAPRTETEEKIARVWSKSFGIEPIGVDDNFFDLAGNSLLAIQIVTQIATETGAEVSMASLLEAPTIAGLAARVDETLGLGAAPPALSEEDEMERLLAEIEALSAEEAEAQLISGSAEPAGAEGSQGA